MKLAHLLLIAAIFIPQIVADAADLTVAPGVFDVRNSGTNMGQLEYRCSRDWSGFRPKTGLFATEDSGIYIFTGIGYPVSINAQWSLVPSLSAGYYDNGADKDLGHKIEFYSQLKLEYLLTSGSRVGLGVGHLSNNRVGDKNPGAETAFLFYSIAL